jgi:hypothetical protein
VLKHPVSAPSLQELGARPRGIAMQRPSVLVVSHERSGTHFLINALAAAYGYPAIGFLDFDQTSLNINYFHARAVGEALVRAARLPSATTIKSHHAVEFFEDALPEILRQMPVFYIHRDPVDVMISYWRAINAWPWHEGPRTTSVLEFAAAEPEGMMLRYQKKQARNLLQRWARHVDGWTEAASRNARINVVRYDQLDVNYENTVGGLASVLGRRSGSLTRPDRRTNVVAGTPSAALPEPDRDALRALALAEVGETMRRHGYA